MTKARIRTLRSAAGENPNLTECLDEIERLQSFTRRGLTPGAEPEDLPNSANGKPAKKPKGGPADPRIAEFTGLWEIAYEAFHKEKYPHGGAKDVQAIKRLLVLAQVSDILDTAWDAWHYPEKFNCARAITIAGFACCYANVRLEVKQAKNGNRPQRSEPPGATL